VTGHPDSLTPEELFRTDDVRVGLRRRSVRSGVAMVVARGAQLLLQLGSAAALARLLTPADFGVLAMISPLAVLVNNIANLGLQTAIIHREELDADETNAFFWHALRYNAVVIGLMAIMAPVLAHFYHEPRVFGITLAWAATIYVATLASVHEALLKRQMRFDLVLRIQLGAIFLSLVVAVGAALAGAGYRALMVQVAVMEFTRAAALWVTCPWRPARQTRGHGHRDGVGALRAYWTNLSGARVVAWLGDQLDRVLIGALGGAPVLGLYDNAKRWATFSFAELWFAVSDVAVASLSRARREAELYRVYLQHACLPLLTVAFPAITFIFVDAREVLYVLLGPQWLGAVGFVRLLCVGTVAGSVGRLMQWVYLSTGQTARQLRWSFVTTPVMVAALLVGARGGAVGVAWGYVSGLVLLAIPSAVNALRFSPVSLAAGLRIFVRPLVASVVSGAALFVVGAHLPGGTSPVISLATRLPLFVAFYAVTWIGLPGGIAAGRTIIAGAQELRAV
jgi:O-antigen/teichoic acid export membrane protein